MSALESRLDTLANALSASTEAGHAMPRELEKLLSGLIEKLEWVQLTHTDHAALGHLEDRIAQLIRRLDASDARLGNLEAVERGLADLLVHINEARAQGSGVALASPARAAAPSVDAIKRDVAEIKRGDQRRSGFARGRSRRRRACRRSAGNDRKRHARSLTGGPGTGKDRSTDRDAENRSGKASSGCAGDAEDR